MGELSGTREADLAGGKGRAEAGELGSGLRAGEARRNTPEQEA